MFSRNIVSLALLVTVVGLVVILGVCEAKPQSIVRERRAVPYQTVKGHFNRPNRNNMIAPSLAKDEALDSALENLSTRDLYRMLELLDMVEEKSRMEKVSEREMDTLKYLMENA